MFLPNPRNKDAEQVIARMNGVSYVIGTYSNPIKQTLISSELGKGSKDAFYVNAFNKFIKCVKHLRMKD